MKTSIKLLTILFLSLGAMIITSCKHKKQVTPEVDYAALGYKSATVLNYEVDGCQWMLEIDGKKYEPNNMQEEFRKDKMKVWVKYTLVKGAMTICMAGEVIKLSDIKERK
jgi:hypothetical protein